MKFTLTLLLAIAVGLGCDAQTNKEVMAPIERVFEGMKKGDSALVRSSFHPNARFHTVLTDTKTNQPVLRIDVPESFYKSVSTPHKDVWNELTWSPKIEVDGNLAQVWVPYAFYLGKTFSHCGVDVFSLFKDATGQWKIFFLADTRHKEGCQVPAEVTDRLK